MWERNKKDISRNYCVNEKIEMYKCLNKRVNASFTTKIIYKETSIKIKVIIQISDETQHTVSGAGVHQWRPLQRPVRQSPTSAFSQHLSAALVSADLPLAVSRRPLDGSFCAQSNNGEPQWRYGVSSALQLASEIERCFVACHRTSAGFYYYNV